MRTMHAAVKLNSWMRAALAVALVSVLAACGGGGSSDSSSSSGSGSNSSSNSPLSGLPASPTQQPIAANAANTVAVTVGQGAHGVINIPAVSVTVCAPGTSNCATINNVQVDTGSYGLRLVNTAVNNTLLSALTPTSLSAGTQVAECATFADGFTFGSVRTATVSIGGETTTAGIPLQIIGDMSNTPVPTQGCGNGSSENTVSDLGANGILGIGVAPFDCGANCSNPTLAVNNSNYFSCPTSGGACARATLPNQQQVANPVAHFATDNNGVIVQMPPISSMGQASATGTLVFGINTQSNNPLAAAQTFPTDAFGDLTNSSFNGNAVLAFFDSGSNGYFFADSSIPLCGSQFPGFYCPTSAQTRSVSLGGISGAKVTASIGILSAATLFANTSNFAFNDLGGQIGGNGNFDLGLPFFYGRYVYYSINQTATGGQQAPFVGY